mmetsp:Transcript_18397/g.38496  ORF Transcript_18397/g.38496 Transcript_18397/m.38496 type:complete len:261 (-) Transcript_18397:351-1133(-)
MIAVLLSSATSLLPLPLPTHRIPVLLLPLPLALRSRSLLSHLSLFLGDLLIVQFVAEFDPRFGIVVRRRRVVGDVAFVGIVIVMLLLAFPFAFCREGTKLRCQFGKFLRGENAFGWFDFFAVQELKLRQSCDDVGAASLPANLLLRGYCCCCCCILISTTSNSTISTIINSIDSHARIPHQEQFFQTTTSLQFIHAVLQIIHIHEIQRQIQLPQPFHSIATSPTQTLDLTNIIQCQIQILQTFQIFQFARHHFGNDIVLK